MARALFEQEAHRFDGLIRADWQDLSGGPGFEAAIQGFFTRLNASAHSPGLRSHA